MIALADQGGLGAVSAEDLDLSKFFSANDVDLLNPDLALGTPDTSSAAGPTLSASSISRQEVPGASMPPSPTPRILPSLVPSSPPMATVPSASTLPFGGMGMGLGIITPETLAAINMHTINMGLMPPAINPLALFAAPQQFNAMDFGAALAAASAAFSAPAGVVSPGSLLSTSPSAPGHALPGTMPQALGAAMLRDGLASVHTANALASPTAPTPPYSSPGTPSTSPLPPPKAPVFGRSSSVASLSAPSSGLSSAATSVPGSPEPFSAPGSNDSLASASTVASAGGVVKPKKKRRPKPRMCELNEQQAQAKRDANRESARKCRERKREKDKEVTCEKAQLADENEQLRVALAAEKAKNEILAKILVEKEGYIAGLHKRLRLDMP